MAITYTIPTGTDIVVEKADGAKVFKKVTRPIVATSDEITANEAGLFVFPVPVNSAGFVRIYAAPEHLDQTYEDEVVPTTTTAMEQRDGEVEPYIQHVDSSIPDGTYTVVDPLRKSDGSYVTIRIETSTNTHKRDGSKNDFFGRRFVQYLSGPDNETNFTSFGFISSQNEVRVFNRLRDSAAMLKYIAAVDVIAEGDRDDARQTYALRSGRCSRCSRKLTVPESVERGLGPECATKV